MIFRKLGMGWGGFVVRRAIRSPRSLVYSFTDLLVYESTRRLVYVSTCLLVYRFTHLRVPASTRLRVYLFTRLPVYLSTSSRVDGVTIARARQGGSAPAPRPRGPVRSPRGSRPEWCRRPRSCRTGFRVRAHRFRS